MMHAYVALKGAYHAFQVSQRVHCRHGLSLIAESRISEIIELNSVVPLRRRRSSAARLTVAAMSGPVIIRVRRRQFSKAGALRRAVAHETNIGVQVNNFVVVFLADHHKRHYKRFH